MPDRLHTYAAALVTDWLASRTSTPYRLTAARDGDVAMFIAEAGGQTAALAIAALWDASANAAAEDARVAMEERLTEGNVRGPYLLWVPPRASVPNAEPAISDFVMRAQMACAPMQPGSRNEIDLPIAIQLAKVRDEGGYASVIGGLSRFWTLITERLNGTYHIDSMQLRRAPQDETVREALFDRIGAAAKALAVGDAGEMDAVEAWTVQRLTADPLGERGFAIAQAPPNIDPADGAVMRRLVRKRLKDASAALADVEAGVKGVGLIGIYEYAEHENIGSFVKSLDPGLYAGLQVVAGIVDGEVRPIFQPRV